MPRRRVPTYRCYKPKNLGLVVLDGKQHYLGAYGTPESIAEYNRLVQEWLARNEAPAASAPDGIPATVNEVILAFWGHAEKHYRKPDGTPTGELDNLRAALSPVRKLYGHTAAREFGPLALRSVRESMIGSGLGRTTVNARINRIRRVFRWAASMELVPASVDHSLSSVPGIQRGRGGVKEPDGIKPVPIEHVNAALPHMPAAVAAMVQIQLRSGCRVGEVMGMTGRDLIQGTPNWEYRPASHKNSWRGQERIILLGPEAQKILRGFLKPDPSAYLFSPRDTVEQHHSRRAQGRRSKPTPSEKARCVSPARGSKHAACYDRRGYRQAIVRACQKAGVPAWSPLQLRHTAATAIRATHGLEAAQVILGHSKADVTQLYAERDLEKAKAVIAAIG